MSAPSTAYLKQALDSTYHTEAHAKSAIDADKAAAVATSFWLEKHSGKSWHIITLDLTLSSHLVSSLGPSYMSQRTLGILTQYTLHTFNSPRTLCIYSSDSYTEQWVHDWVQARTLDASSRVLNIVRSDSASNLIDLGEFNLGH